MAILASGKIGREFRVTLPKEVRKLLELKEGDELVFFTAEGWNERVCFRKG
jgi:AbrB family looped-hinge helix DNA binding protein